MTSQYKVILLAVVLAAATTAQSFPLKVNEIERRLKEVIPPKKTQAVINNDLEGEEDMEVHCQEGVDPYQDFGIQEVKNGDHYTLVFWPPVGKAIYNCSFVFNAIQHKFDVYRNGRDAGCGDARTCTWNIKENGPCFHDGNLPQDHCYPWN